VTDVKSDSCAGLCTVQGASYLSTLRYLRYGANYGDTH